MESGDAPPTPPSVPPQAGGRALIARLPNNYKIYYSRFDVKTVVYLQRHLVCWRGQRRDGRTPL